jgi:hypothetical protein
LGVLNQRKNEPVSIFADGVWMVRMRPNGLVGDFGFTEKASELTEIMAEAGMMTQTAAAAALGCGRHEVNGAARSLWFSGMMDVYCVVSKDAQGANSQFHLWVLRGHKPPADAREACRMAVLALFYGHAIIEMPGFGWKVTRGPGRPVVAEVRFRNPKGENVRWVIDAPRRGEEPLPEADLYIFPAAEQAEEKTPAGKSCTTDLEIAWARPGELRKAVKAKHLAGKQSVANNI